MKNQKQDQKSDSAGQGVVSSSKETVTQTEFLIRVSCTKAPDGTRACQIKDIVVDNPHTDNPIQTHGEISQKESLPTVIDASEGPTVADAKPQDAKSCELCDLLSNMIKPMKDAQPVPRRFTSWRREDKIIT